MNYAALTKTTTAKKAAVSTTSKSAEAPKEAIGLDFLSTLEVAEEIEFTVPFDVTLVWDNVGGNGSVTGVKNIRFFTSKLANASFEATPVIEPGFVPDGYRGESGTLVVKVAKQDSMFSIETTDTGFRKISFLARPKFVSFNGREAVKFADAAAAQVGLADLMKALQRNAEVK